MNKDRKQYTCMSRIKEPFIKVTDDDTASVQTISFPWLRLQNLLSALITYNDRKLFEDEQSSPTREISAFWIVL